MNKIYCALLVVLIGFSGNVSGQETATIADGMFQTDDTLDWILCNQDLNTVNSQLSGENFTKIHLSEEYVLGEAVEEFAYGAKYQVTRTSDSKEYTLFFTELPIMSITTDNVIVDEPRVMAEFYMSEPDQTITESYLGIEYKGQWTQASLPKKSFRIEFWDEDENEIDMELLGLRSDDDWNLEAMMNEQTRLNKKVGFELWDTIDTLYYLGDEDRAINGVRMKYVELFLTGKYWGVYGLSERIDRKQLRLKKVKNNALRGELYEAELGSVQTWLGRAPEYDNTSEWYGGFQLKHPKPDELIDWSQLHAFLAHFNEGQPIYYLPEDYRDWVEIDNMVNYYLFLNIIRGYDNKSKNYFLAKYDAGEPYFFVPWGIDAIFGTSVSGRRKPDEGDMMENILHSKMLYDCKPDGFVDRLKNRWAFLRQEIFTSDYIVGKMEEDVVYLYKNGVYEREFIRWKENTWYEYPDGDPSEYLIDHLDYVRDWLDGRIQTVDAYIYSKCPQLNP